MSEEPAGELPPRRRGLVLAWLTAALLFVLVCGLTLYAFMLNVDLDEVKRRLSDETQARQLADLYLIETRNQLFASQREIEQLRQQLALRESDYQATISAKPAMPVVVNFRESMLGQGLVAVIRNQSDRHLTVMLSLRNSTLSSVKRFRLDLGPRSSTDFGHLEGWQFASGDEFSLYNDDFAVLKLTVP